MTLCRKNLKAYSDSMRIKFTKAQKQIILERFGAEPDDVHVWSEQDIAEQIRKICGQR